MRERLNEFIDTIDARKMVTVLSWLIGAASLSIFTAFIVYFSRFHDGFSAKQEVWGTFGDFIGGTVNPLLSFLSLIALVFTVVLQTRQLEHSREELANSKAELVASREEMARSTEIQRMSAVAAKSQARYANVSTRLAALQAALAVANDVVKQMQVGGIVQNIAGYQQALKNKEGLVQMIMDLTQELLNDSTDQ